MAEENTSKVMAKGLRLLERVVHRKGEVGVSDLARDLELDKATVFRFLNTLVESGYLVRKENGRYALTSRLAELARLVPPPPTLMELALPQMRKLAMATSEAAYISVINGDDAVWLDEVGGKEALRVRTPHGARTPLHCGSGAKVLLAFQDAKIIARVSSRLAATTPYSITDPKILMKELAAIRRHGYAIGQQESRLGVSGVSAPVWDASSSLAASLGISGPSDRLTKARLKALAPEVVRAANQLSGSLGWRARPSE
jgi:IclR family transcriptional regulator, KDG regulon repressor